MPYWHAQLPADPAIDVLEQGQFVKYDYAAGLVNFTGAGEWMLVYNEIKLYREHQLDCEFAMKKGDYQARVYSPLDGTRAAEEMYGPTRFLDGKRERWDGEKFVPENFKIGNQEVGALPVFEGGEVKKDADGNPIYTLTYPDANGVYTIEKTSKFEQELIEGSRYYIVLSFTSAAVSINIVTAAAWDEVPVEYEFM